MGNDSSSDWADWSYFNGYDHATGANFSPETGNDFVAEAVEVAISYATDTIDNYLEGYEAGMDKDPLK